MEYITKVPLLSSGRTNYLHYMAKQYDENSRIFICTITDNSSLLNGNNTAKATVLNKWQTLDVIDCTIDTESQTITFTLSKNSLLKAGTIYIDVSIFENDAVKLTCGSIIVDVIKSADGNIQQNIDSGNSLFEKLQDISNRIDTLSSTETQTDIQTNIDKLLKLSAFAMNFIKETVYINATKEYKLTANDIAPLSPVYVSIKGRTNYNDLIFRSDGENLVDILTGKIVDSTMTDIQITADDVIAGIKSTDGMSIQVKYYSANCDDLLQMVGNINYEDLLKLIENNNNNSGGYKVKYTPVITATYTPKEE